MPTLYDQYGRPIDLARLKQEEAGPTVTGVRSPYAGHPADGLTPVRLARLLREAEDGDATSYLELAEQMEERDLHYRSVLATRKNQVAGLEVTVEAASDDADDVRAADLVRAWINRLELQDELFDILDAVGKGFSVTEIIWETSERQWMPARLEWRDQRWFDFDRVDRRTILLRGEGGLAQPLTPYKYITHVHKSKSGLPIRGGLARPAAWAYLFKNFDVKAWIIFAEAYGHPLRIGKYGPGASERDKQVLLSAVRNLGQDAAAIMPSSMAVDFVEAKLSGSLDLFERLADWMDRQVSKAVLGQTGTTDVGQHVGTAQAHERVRADIEASDCRQLSVTLTRDVARPLVDLNMGPRKAYPVIRVFRPDPEDLDGLVKRLEALVPMGLQVEEAWMRDKIGVPDPDKGARLLVAAGKPAAEPTDAGDEQLAAQAAGAGAEDAGDGIDDLVEEQLAEWQPLVAPLIDPIEALLAECRSLEEFRDRLAEVKARMDPSALAEALARGGFAARLAGETETDLG